MDRRRGWLSSELAVSVGGVGGSEGGLVVVVVAVRYEGGRDVR